MTETDRKVLKVTYDALDEKFAADIKIYDVQQHTTISEYFVIATANSVQQAKAISEGVEVKLKENGILIKQIEGESTALWILLDVASVIVHIFTKENREHYNLDEVYSNAQEISIEEINNIDDIKF